MALTQLPIFNMCVSLSLVCVYILAHSSLSLLNNATRITIFLGQKQQTSTSSRPTIASSNQQSAGIVNYHNDRETGIFNVDAYII